MNIFNTQETALKQNANLVLARHLPGLSRFRFYAEMGKDDFGWPVAMLVESPLSVGERQLVASVNFPTLPRFADDAERVVYTREDGETFDLFRTRSDGTGGTKRLTDTPNKVEFLTLLGL